MRVKVRFVGASEARVRDPPVASLEEARALYAALYGGEASVSSVGWLQERLLSRIALPEKRVLKSKATSMIEVPVAADDQRGVPLAEAFEATKARYLALKRAADAERTGVEKPPLDGASLAKLRDAEDAYLFHPGHILEGGEKEVGDRDVAAEAEMCMYGGDDEGDEGDVVATAPEPRKSTGKEGAARGLSSLSKLPRMMMVSAKLKGCLPTRPDEEEKEVGDRDLAAAAKLPRMMMCLCGGDDEGDVVATAPEPQKTSVERSAPYHAIRTEAEYRSFLDARVSKPKGVVLSFSDDGRRYTSPCVPMDVLDRLAAAGLLTDVTIHGFEFVAPEAQKKINEWRLCHDARRLFDVFVRHVYALKAASEVNKRRLLDARGHTIDSAQQHRKEPAPPAALTLSDVQSDLVRFACANGHTVTSHVAFPTDFVYAIAHEKALDPGVLVRQTPCRYRILDAPLRREVDALMGSVYAAHAEEIIANEPQRPRHLRQRPAGPQCDERATFRYDPGAPA
jgi:hypothetical protein